jgi:hypothetical protein
LTSAVENLAGNTSGSKNARNQARGKKFQRNEGSPLRVRKMMAASGGRGLFSIDGILDKLDRFFWH